MAFSCFSKVPDAYLSNKAVGANAMLDEKHYIAKSALEESLDEAQSAEEQIQIYSMLIENDKQIFRNTQHPDLFRDICKAYEKAIGLKPSPLFYQSYMDFLGNDIFNDYGINMFEEAISVGKKALSEFPTDAGLLAGMYDLCECTSKTYEAYEYMMKLVKLKYGDARYLIKQFGMDLWHCAPGCNDVKTMPFYTILHYKGREVYKEANALYDYADYMLSHVSGNEGLVLMLFCKAYELSPGLLDVKEKIMEAYVAGMKNITDPERKEKLMAQYKDFLGTHKAFKPATSKENKEEKKQAHNIQVFHPMEIKKGLDSYVIGQEQPKRALSVALYTHLLRIDRKRKTGKNDIEKSNVLILGPTGCGKTYIAKTLAQIANVPFVIFDASKITASGYVGADAEDCLKSLLLAAGGDKALAEKGIVYLDEGDKIAARRMSFGDVGGEAAQQQLLKLLEGSIVNVQTGAHHGETTEIDTTNILFIVGGAFSGTIGSASLEEKVNDRSGAEGIGFKAEKQIEQAKGALRRLADKDLQAYGFLPEFAGRLHTRVVLDKLTQQELRRILVEPADALIPQYERQFAASRIRLEVMPEALDLIAEEAYALDAGARSLRTICEMIFQDSLFYLPGSNTALLKIDEKFVKEELAKAKGVY